MTVIAVLLWAGPVSSVLSRSPSLLKAIAVPEREESAHARRMSLIHLALRLIFGGVWRSSVDFLYAALMMFASAVFMCFPAFRPPPQRINGLPADAFHNCTDEFFMDCNTVVLISLIKILNFSG